MSIPTDNSDTFNIEIVQKSGDKLRLVCRYPTYKEFKQVLKEKKVLETMNDEEAYYQKIEDTFFPFLTNKDEVLDKLTALDIIQIKNSFLDESILSEVDKKKSASQSLVSTPELEAKTSE